MQFVYLCKYAYFPILGCKGSVFILFSRYKMTKKCKHYAFFLSLFKKYFIKLPSNMAYMRVFCLNTVNDRAKK